MKKVESGSRSVRGWKQWSSCNDLSGTIALVDFSFSKGKSMNRTANHMFSSISQCVHLLFAPQESFVAFRYPLEVQQSGEWASAQTIIENDLLSPVDSIGSRHFHIIEH